MDSALLSEIFRSIYHRGLNLNSTDPMLLQYAMYLVDAAGQKPIFGYSFELGDDGPYSKELRQETYSSSKGKIQVEINTGPALRISCVESLMARRNPDYDMVTWAKCLASMHLLMVRKYSVKTSFEILNKAIRRSFPDMASDDANFQAFNDLRELII